MKKVFDELPDPTTGTFSDCTYDAQPWSTLVASTMAIAWSFCTKVCTAVTARPGLLLSSMNVNLTG